MTGLVLASWSSPAEATEFDLEWSAPAGCPSRLDIIEAARARLPESPSNGPPKVFIHGTVTPERGGFVISLALKDKSGALVGERHVTVEGERCKAVESPTALLLAIMIAERPGVESAAAPERAHQDEAPWSGPSGPSSTAPLVGPVAPRRNEPAASSVVRAASPPKSAPARLSLGVAGVTSLGLLPNVGLGAALRATYAPGTLVFFGLEAGFDVGAPIHAGTGEVRFQLLSGSALAGLRLPLQETPVELILTAAARAGAIFVQPTNFAVVHSQVGTAVLAGPGVLVRSRLGARLFLDAWPEIDAVLVRDRFWIRDGETFEIHRPSLVSGRLSVGLGYEFR